METAQSLVSDILREIYVQANEQDIPAVEFETCLRYLNRMMAEFDADGIKLGWTILSNPADVATVPMGAINGIIFNAALRVANQYDVEVGPLLAINAERGLETMRKLGVSIPKQSFPSTLPIGSGNEDDVDVFGNFYPGCNEDDESCQH